MQNARNCNPMMQYDGVFNYLYKSNEYFYILHGLMYIIVEWAIAMRWNGLK